MLVARNPGTTGATPIAAKPADKPPAVVPAKVVAATPATIVAPPPAPIVAPAPQQAIIPAAPAPSTALAPVQRSARPSLPAFIAADASDKPVGFENVGNEANRLAMLSIAQANSPQVSELRKMQAGDTYLTTDREVIFFPACKQVPCIPFFYYKSIDLWNHRDLGGGIANSSYEMNGTLAKLAQTQAAWRRKPENKGRQPSAQEQPAAAVETLNFMVLFKTQDVEDGPITYVPVVIPMAKSKYRKGATWINLAMKASEGKYPLYSFEYNLQTVFEKNKKGDPYYNWDVDFSPDPLSAEDYAQAKKAAEEFKTIFEMKQLQTVADKDDSTPEIEIIEGGADPKTPPAPGSY